MFNVLWQVHDDKNGGNQAASPVQIGLGMLLKTSTELHGHEMIEVNFSSEPGSKIDSR